MTSAMEVRGQVAPSVDRRWRYFVNLYRWQHLQIRPRTNSYECAGVNGRNIYIYIFLKRQILFSAVTTYTIVLNGYITHV